MKTTKIQVIHFRRNTIRYKMNICVTNWEILSNKSLFMADGKNNWSDAICIIR